MSVLRNLPVAVSSQILDEWLPFPSIGLLDAAIRCTKLRHELLDVIDATTFSASGIRSAFSHSLLQWLLKRGIKVSVLRYDARDEALVSPYLEKFGTHVLSIDRTNISSTSIPISQLCLNLQSYSGSWEAFAPFQSAPELQVLSLFTYSEQKIGTSACAELPKLQVLTCTCGNERASNAALDLIAKGSSTLQTILIGGDTAAPELAAALSQCKRLKALGLPVTWTSDAMLDAITSSCPGIEHLDLSNSVDVTDEGMLKVLQNLKGLRSLSVTSCAKLTDLTLQYIIQYCANTLEELHVQQSKFTHPAIAALRAACTALHTYRCCGEWDPTDFTNLLVISRPPNQKMLSGAVKFPRVEIMDMQGCVNFGRITAADFNKVMKKCPLVHTVAVREENVAKLSKLLIKFPNVKISTEDQRKGYDVLRMTGNEHFTKYLL